ncbi:hypothetical protein, partial [Nocardia asiatica]|uniref:hypothetical protein n=1 Tax=Nocardia asiatica TaxID=209252 RepID=UPI001C3F1629
MKIQVNQPQLITNTHRPGSLDIELLPIVGIILPTYPCHQGIWSFSARIRFRSFDFHAGQRNRADRP